MSMCFLFYIDFKGGTHLTEEQGTAVPRVLAFQGNPFSISISISIPNPKSRILETIDQSSSVLNTKKWLG